MTARAAESSAGMVTAALHGSRKKWSGWADWLAEAPLFAGLSKRQQKKVAELATLRWYPDARQLVRLGGRGDVFFAILNGRARLETPTGLVRELGAKESFGELSLIDGAERSATVTSLGGVSVACIARSDFVRLLREEGAMGLRVAQSLVSIVRAMQSTSAQEARIESDAPLNVPTESSSGEVMLLLGSLPLFSELSKRQLKKVAKLAQTRTHPAGSVVVQAGGRGDAFYMVTQGVAQVTTPDGHSHELRWGDSFGELALLDGAPRAATVDAVEELAVLRIPRSAFLKLMNEEPTVSLGVVRGLVALIRRLQQEETA